MLTKQQLHAYLLIGNRVRHCHSRHHARPRDPHVRHASGGHSCCNSRYHAPGSWNHLRRCNSTCSMSAQHQQTMSVLHMCLAADRHQLTQLGCNRQTIKRCAYHCCCPAIKPSTNRVGSAAYRCCAILCHWNVSCTNRDRCNRAITRPVTALVCSLHARLPVAPTPAPCGWQRTITGSPSLLQVRGDIPQEPCMVTFHKSLPLLPQRRLSKLHARAQPMRNHLTSMRP